MNFKLKFSFFIVSFLFFCIYGINNTSAAYRCNINGTDYADNATCSANCVQTACFNASGDFQTHNDHWVSASGNSINWQGGVINLGTGVTISPSGFIDPWDDNQLYRIYGSGDTLYITHKSLAGYCRADTIDCRITLQVRIPGSSISGDTGVLNWDNGSYHIKGAGNKLIVYGRYCASMARTGCGRWVNPSYEITLGSSGSQSCSTTPSCTSVGPYSCSGGCSSQFSYARYADYQASDVSCLNPISSHVYSRDCSCGAKITDPNNYTSSCVAPTLDLWVNPTPISAGSSTTINWTANDATSCWASGGWSGSKSPSGSPETVWPPSPTTYSMECWNAVGTSTGLKSVIADVTASTPGDCGAVDGGSLNSEPTSTQGCDEGAFANLSFSVATNQWSWQCLGTGTGNSPWCYASKCTSVIERCGSADETTRTTAPSTLAEKCAEGTPAPILGTGPWAWSCVDYCDGGIDTCSANFSSVGPSTNKNYKEVAP